MTPRIAVSVAIAVTVGLAGCSKSSVRTLRDTEGRTIRAQCTPDGKCELRLTSGSPAKPELDRLAIGVPGNLVAICDTKDGKPAATTDCRALECSGDTECPPSHGLKDGTCINGLCREPSVELNKEDAKLLCLAGTGLGATRPDLVALAVNCGTPCRVPAVCRQP